MERTTIQELYGRIATSAKISIDDAERLVKAMFSIISEEVANGNPVKVRGLGMFKIVDVDSRESISVNTGERVVIEGHEKLSFIPDATMKELVNRPFSQFETVVLNDGVEFVDEETVKEQPIAQTEELPAEEKITIEETVQENDNTKEDTERVEYGDEETTEPERHTHKTVNVLLWSLLWIVVIIVSAFIGYLYGVNETTINKQIAQLFNYTEKPTVPHKSTEKPIPAASKNTEPIITDSMHNSAKEKKTVKEEETIAKEAQPEAIDYDALDARVRTGAYRIVGLQSEVVIKQGETLKRISERMLGPGMECYVEVYNAMSSDTKLTAGHKLKIPKLELKKKRHKRIN